MVVKLYQRWKRRWVTNSICCSWVWGGIHWLLMCKRQEMKVQVWQLFWINTWTLEDNQNAKNERTSGLMEIIAYISWIWRISKLGKEWSWISNISVLLSGYDMKCFCYVLWVIHPNLAWLYLCSPINMKLFEDGRLMRKEYGLNFDWIRDWET